VKVRDLQECYRFVAVFVYPSLCLWIQFLYKYKYVSYILQNTLPYSVMCMFLIIIEILTELPNGKICTGHWKQFLFQVRMSGKSRDCRIRILLSPISKLVKPWLKDILCVFFHSATSAGIYNITKHTELLCTVLYCTLLYSTVLYYNILYCTSMYYISQYDDIYVYIYI